MLSSHEARVAVTAAAMSRSGLPWHATPIDVPQVELHQSDAGSHLRQRDDGATWSVNPWLVPVFEGQIRLQKPPLPYWTTAIAFKLFGESAAVARLVPALLGVLTCFLTYILAREIAGRRVATIAMALAVSSYFSIDEFRKVMADPFLACISLGAIVAWIRASASHRSSLIVLFYALLAAGSLAKGPVVFLHVGVAIAAFSFVFHRWPRVKWYWHLVGVALYLAIALPWPIYIVTHLPTALEIWRFESVGEFVDNRRNARPFYFYLPGLLLLAAPWTAGLIASGVDLWKRRSRNIRRRTFGWIWLVAIVIVFSLSHMKKNAYLLPLMPAITLITAQAVVRVLAITRRRPSDPGLAWTATAHWIAGIIFAVLTAVSSFRELSTIPAIIISLLSVGIALLPLPRIRQRAYERWFNVQAVSFALLILIFLAFPDAARTLRKRSASVQEVSLPLDTSPTVAVTSR